MVIKQFTDNDVLSAAKLNENFELSINNELLTKIDQLIDRNVIRSNDKISPFVEAYTSAGGRKGSVNAGDTTAFFDSNKYIPTSDFELIDGTNHNPDSFSDPDNGFDGDDETESVKTQSNSNHFTWSLGRTFSAQSIVSCKINCSLNWGFTTNVGGCSLSLQKFDGSTWETIATLASANAGNVTSVSYNSTRAISESNILGLRINFNNNASDQRNNTATLRNFEITTPGDSEIVHTIPSGTFLSTVNKGIAAVKIVDWEDGASLQWKATAAPEDTGWKDFNIDGETAYAKLSGFTAFKSEPSTFIIKLIPKTTSPTAGAPSISGAAIQLGD